MEIHEIDKNLAVDKSIDKTGLVFADIDSEPFRIYGVERDGDNYWRLPKEVAKATSAGVYGLASNTAGGRIRFVTDSTRIAIIVTYSTIYHAPHMPLTGAAGFDVYVGERYYATFVPPVQFDNKAYESVMSFPTKEERTVTVNMPLYSSPTRVYIGVNEGANVKRAQDYSIECPVVYYGSSITQGGCASHAGMSYQGILSRRLDCNFINLGFSGNGKAEPPMAEYIANLSMSAFVYDYDHNAPSPEYLAETHERMFLTIREKQPELPVLMISKPDYWDNAVCNKRFAIIEKTYENALRRGDKNVYLIHGKEFFSESAAGLEPMVDGCHPTDLGFYMMANKIEPVLRKMLGM